MYLPDFDQVFQLYNLVIKASKRLLDILEMVSTDFFLFPLIILRMSVGMENYKIMFVIYDR